MKKICESVNRNKTVVLIVAIGLTVVLLAVLFLIGGADISVFGNELLYTVIAITGTLVFTFVSSRIIPNKKYAEKIYIFFSAVLALFFIFNIISLNISGMTVAIPVCIAIFLLTAAKISE